MKTLLLALLLLVPSIQCVSKVEIEQEKIALECQKENDDLKFKVALIAAAVTVLFIWFKGKGEDVVTFDKMMLDILTK
jgi:hypothetical protein